MYSSLTQSLTQLTVPKPKHIQAKLNLIKLRLIEAPFYSMVKLALQALYMLQQIHPSVSLSVRHTPVFCQNKFVIFRKISTQKHYGRG